MLYKLEKIVEIIQVALIVKPKRIIIYSTLSCLSALTYGVSCVKSTHLLRQDSEHLRHLYHSEISARCKMAPSFRRLSPESRDRRMSKGVFATLAF